MKIHLIYKHFTRQHWVKEASACTLYTSRRDIEPGGAESVSLLLCETGSGIKKKVAGLVEV